MQFVIAFVVGGLICVVGQLLIDFTKLTPARILVTFVTLGVALTAIGVYEPLVDFAGAGATVPLTGFGYTLAIGVREAVQDFWLDWNFYRRIHRRRRWNCGGSWIRLFSRPLLPFWG